MEQWAPTSGVVKGIQIVRAKTPSTHVLSTQCWCPSLPGDPLTPAVEQSLTGSCLPALPFSGIWGAVCGQHSVPDVLYQQDLTAESWGNRVGMAEAARARPPTQETLRKGACLAALDQEIPAGRMPPPPCHPDPSPARHISDPCQAGGEGCRGRDAPSPPAPCHPCRCLCVINRVIKNRMS